jgi:predicted nuclease of restriction endonuclease-like (RecB) superfamily
VDHGFGSFVSSPRHDRPITGLTRSAAQQAAWLMAARSGLPSNYPATLAAAKAAIQAARTRAVLAANSELIGLYWQLGRLILDRQQLEGWGARVIQRLSDDLRAEFPGMTGLSPRNLRYMRTFAERWGDAEIVQQLAAQLPWGHHMLLLDKLDEQTNREWYARATIEHGWSRAVLEHAGCRAPGWCACWQ